MKNKFIIFILAIFLYSCNQELPNDLLKKDTTPPIITLSGQSSVEVNRDSTYTDEGATASDDIDGDITSSIQTINPIDISTIGEYLITYSVTDAAGNNAIQVTRTVNVVADTDATKPIITLTGSSSLSITKGTTYTDGGATASDNIDGDITSSIVVNNTVDTTTVGEYTITYNVSDTAGNVADGVSRTVSVISNQPGPDDIKLASWNIRILSNNSRDDNELTKISNIIKRYDIIAIQEVRDSTVLERLETLLPEYDYIVSTAVGNTVKEMYAYFYKSSLFTVLGSHVYNDVNDVFIREPYIGHFRAGTFDFTLISIHVLYGTTTERREEIKLLDDVISDVDTYNGAENDVILLGDFNFPSDDRGWQITTHTPQIEPTLKTTITDTSSYDNLWLNENNTTEYVSFYEIYKFDEVDFSNDDDTASLEVSDHRPISFYFSIDGVDDDEDGSWTSGSTSGVGVSNGSATRTDGDVVITNIVTQPTESESITLTNNSTWDVDLSDWILGDKNNPTSYGIPNDTIIAAGGTVTFSHTQLGFGINNTGEIIYLTDSTGSVYDTWQ